MVDRRRTGRNPWCPVCNVRHSHPVHDQDDEPQPPFDGLLTDIDRATITLLFEDSAAIPADLFPAIEAIVEAKVRRATATDRRAREGDLEARARRARECALFHKGGHSIFDCPGVVLPPATGGGSDV